jgi:hypothetical protein
MRLYLARGLEVASDGFQELSRSCGRSKNRQEPRKKDPTELSDQSSQERDSHGEPHPARRWVVERTISWLVKRRSLRTCWSKKAQNWSALIQLACAHVLLNLAILEECVEQPTLGKGCEARKCRPKVGFALVCSLMGLVGFVLVCSLVVLGGQGLMRTDVVGPLLRDARTIEVCWAGIEAAESP